MVRFSILRADIATKIKCYLRGSMPSDSTVCIIGSSVARQRLHNVLWLVQAGVRVENASSLLRVCGAGAGRVRPMVRLGRF